MSICTNIEINTSQSSSNSMGMMSSVLGMQTPEKNQIKRICTQFFVVTQKVDNVHVSFGQLHEHPGLPLDVLVT